MTHPAPALSVVMVNFNTRERTIEAIASLVEQPVEGLEVVLVDNGSVDGSVGAIAQRFPGITVIAAGENLGFARGVNRGVAASHGDFVLLLNPDTTVLPGSIEALLAHARRHPGHGLYGGRIQREDGSTDPGSCWGEMSLWSLFCFASGLSTLRPRSRLLDPESLGRWERDTVREVPVVTGCLLLTPRPVWDALGGLDERFFLYAEDADFSRRARAGGWRPVIVPDAVIVHDWGASSGSSGARMCMIMAGKATLVRLGWRPVAARLGLVFLIAGSGLRAALEAVTRRGNRSWTEVWRRRAEWSPGYPRAEETLFGRASAGAAP